MTRKLIYFFRNLSRKHRLSLRRAHNDREVWYMHISPIEMLGSILALLLVLFILLLTLVAYTPILNLIPGYSGNRAREDMMQNIIKVDSIERKLNELEVYYANVSLIMEGKTPITRNVQQAGDSLLTVRHETVPPSREDSILRSQLEGDGPYSLSSIVEAMMNVRPGVELRTPVSGIITAGFDPVAGSYGVTLATAVGQPVMAVDDGTVILSAWLPEEGYIVQIQHSDNLVSTYRMGAQPIISLGSRVRPGEVIGYTAEGINEETGTPVKFELWQNGSPLDPVNYILF